MPSMAFDTSVPLAERRAIARARMEALGMRLGTHVEEGADWVAAVGATAGGRGFRVHVIIDDALEAGYGPTGSVALLVAVDNRIGAIDLRCPDEDSEPDARRVPLRGRLHVCAETEEAREAMREVAGRMPTDFVTVATQVFVETEEAAIEIERDAIRIVLDIWSQSDEEQWAMMSADLEAQIDGLARLAAVVESATPGREARCEFCGGRYVMLADHACPHCGARAT
jgi:hypothetical protein